MGLGSVMCAETRVEGPGRPLPSAGPRPSLSRVSCPWVLFQGNLPTRQWFSTFLSYVSDEGFFLENAKTERTTSGPLYGV